MMIIDHEQHNSSILLIIKRAIVYFSNCYPLKYPLFLTLRRNIGPWICPKWALQNG